MYREGLSLITDNAPLGPPKRVRDAQPPAHPDDPGNWEAVPGKKDLWRNRVTGAMKYTPKDPTEWPFPTLPVPYPNLGQGVDLAGDADDQGIDFVPLRSGELVRYDGVFRWRTDLPLGAADTSRPPLGEDTIEWARGWYDRLVETHHQTTLERSQRLERLLKGRQQTVAPPPVVGSGAALTRELATAYGISTRGWRAAAAAEQAKNDTRRAQYARIEEAERQIQAAMAAIAPPVLPKKWSLAEKMWASVK